MAARAGQRRPRGGKSNGKARGECGGRVNGECACAGVGGETEIWGDFGGFWGPTGMNLGGLRLDPSPPPLRRGPGCLDHPKIPENPLSAAAGRVRDPQTVGGITPNFGVLSPK